MSWRTLTPTEIRKSIPVFVANVFFSLHYAAILYVNSSLLEKYFSETAVSILFAIGALGNMLIFLVATRLLRTYGNRALFFIFLFVDMLATAGMAEANTKWSIAAFFVIFEAVSVMVYFCLDIFLEDASLEENTGEIRGIDLTLANAAIALGPVLVALFAVEDDFSKLYWISALLVLPILYQAFFSFPTFRDGETPTEEKDLATAFHLWLHHANIRRATITRFLLEFFYAFMVIYIPPYLHNTIGFSWTEIGTMFSIMLIAFVIFQLPAGEAADRWWGEKEILIAGFICTGISVMVMPYIGKDLVVWTMALFLSRIGAALIEIMTDSYFFKHVDKRDTGLISLFRISRPTGLVAGGAFGLIVLVYTSYPGIFFTLGMISLCGIWESLRLTDTK